jgi:hypothetical protein
MCSENDFLSKIIIEQYKTEKKQLASKIPENIPVKNIFKEEVENN